jgi:HlyD family secretion protein
MISLPFTNISGLAERAAHSSRRPAVRRPLVTILAALALAACGGDKEAGPRIDLAMAERRTVTVNAEASGNIEPINVVEVKSKASGQIMVMPVETGYEVKRGDLLVQLDRSEVDQRFNQAKADRDVALARVEQAKRQRERETAMFDQRIISRAEYDNGSLNVTNAEAAFIRAEAALQIAEQQRQDATVRAPIDGTIIQKMVSVGSVITSSTGSMGAGTTMLQMADLSKVRVRALFNETDIGQVQAGMAARVSVDAHQGRPFPGVVEKIEPTAVVQQNVAMFPVLIALDNEDNLLKPGMNGEVSVQVAQARDVIAIPSEALRTAREAEFAATILGLNPDSVRASVNRQEAELRAGAGMNVERAMPGDIDPAAFGSGAGDQTRGNQAQGPGQQRGQGSGRGNVQMPTQAECAPVRAAYQANPAAKARLDSIAVQLRGADEATRTTLNSERTRLLETLKLDATLATRCRMLEGRGTAGAGGAAPQGGGQGGQGGTGAAGPAAAPPGMAPQGAGNGPQGGFGARRGGAAAGGTSLVFVAVNGTYEPRMIRTGLTSFDYTEVRYGLDEGEAVAILSSAALQAGRQAQQDAMRARQSGPLGAPGGGNPGGGGRGGR